MSLEGDNRGQVLWEYDIGFSSNNQFSNAGLLSPDGNTFYATEVESGITAAINTADGSEKWRITLDSFCTHESGSALTTDGSVLFVPSSSSVTAYYTADGSVKWQYAVRFVDTISVLSFEFASDLCGDCLAER